MRARFAALPVLVASLAIATSGVAVGQADPSAPPTDASDSALQALCAANAEDEAALGTCVEVVQTIVEEPGLSDRIDAIVEEAVAAADGLEVEAAIEDVELAIDEALATLEGDVEAALEEAQASLGELDVQALVDGAVSSAQELDVATLIEDAVASAQELDMQGLVDEVVTEIQEADMMSTIEEGIEETRNVVDAAQVWIEENPELVCDTGSVSIGVGAAAVVGFLTDSPSLSLVAYREAQKAADGACGVVIG